jgi:hypothetical protein
LCDPRSLTSYSNSVRAKAVPGGSVQRDAIHTAGPALAQAVARVGRPDTTFFIRLSQSRERRKNRLSCKWESPLGGNLGFGNSEQGKFQPENGIRSRDFCRTCSIA